MSHFSGLVVLTVWLYTVMPEVCRWFKNGKQRKTDIRLTDHYINDSSNRQKLRDCRSLNQNWSYQPTLAGRAIM